MSSPCNLRWVGITAACLAFAAPSYAQQGRISGRLTDESTGGVLISAFIQIVGTSRSTLSTAQGTYVLGSLNPGAYQLRVVSLAYASATRSVTVSPGETVTADWALKPVPFALETVVVTATGEQLVRELGSAVGKIDARTLTANAPV